MYTMDFSPAVRGFNNREPIEVVQTGCLDKFSINDVIAPGFDVKCEYWTKVTNITYALVFIGTVPKRFSTSVGGLGGLSGQYAECLDNANCPMFQVETSYKPVGGSVFAAEGNTSVSAILNHAVCDLNLGLIRYNCYTHKLDFAA